MNETYIKRQITLLNLGIPMSDDIQKYYDDFNLLFNSIGELKKEKEYDEVVCWTNSKNITIINYDYGECEFWAAPFFGNYLKMKYDLNDWEIRLTLNLFLENIFNLEVKVYKNYMEQFEELFDDE